MKERTSFKHWLCKGLFFVPLWIQLRNGIIRVGTNFPLKFGRKTYQNYFNWDFSPFISKEKENIFSDNQDSLLATGDQGNNNQGIFQLEKCEFTGKSWNSRHNAQTGSVLINVIKNPLQRPQLWLLDLGLPPAWACWLPAAAAWVWKGCLGAMAHILSMPCTWSPHTRGASWGWPVAGEFQVIAPAGDFPTSPSGPGEKKPAAHHPLPHCDHFRYSAGTIWGSH